MGRPFKAILDIGTTKATTGNRVFGVLKGACDGGLHVPHSVRKYPGYFREETGKKGTYDAEVHKTRIMGGHIDQYMEELKNSSEDLFNKQFSKWNKCLSAAKAENCEALFKKVHAGIRADPTYKKVQRKPQAKTQYADKRRTDVKVGNKTYHRDRRLTYAERKQRLNIKIKMAQEAAE